MFKQTKRFLLASVCCLVTLCVAVFFWVSVYMNTKSENAISEIGMIYMSEMSRQIQQKFDAVIGLHLSQAEGIVRLIGPDEADHQELREKLAQNAEVRGFTYLGLYTKDGRGEHVYGGSVEAVDGNEFQGVLKDEGENVSSGYDQNGDKVLLLTVHAEYPMEDGDRSSFLVVGIPMEELSAALVLEEADSMVYYHIIHKDGTFVIRSGEAYRDNYFTRVEELFREFAGRTPEEYAQELRDAINANVDYSTLAMIEGTHRHLYCSPLPGSEWYLVAVMPYGTLDDAVEHLGEQRQNTMHHSGGSDGDLCAVLPDVSAAASGAEQSGAGSRTGKPGKERVPLQHES